MTHPRLPSLIAALPLVLWSLSMAACTGNADTRLKPPPDGAEVPSWPPRDGVAAEAQVELPKRPAELAVVTATPSGQVADVGAISVVFNQEMVQPGFGVPATSGPFTISPAVEGAFAWWGARTVVFRPTRPLPPATSFEVRVPSGLKAASGAALKADHIFRFETPGLAVTEAYSPDTHFGPASPIRLTFSLPVSQAEAVRGVGLRERKGDRVAVSVTPATVREGKRDVVVPGSFIVRPAKPLAMGADYELFVDASVKAEGSDAPLGKAWAQTFTTYDALKVAYVGCGGDGDRCAPGASVQLGFNNPVQAEQLMRCVKVAPKTPVEVAYSYDTDVYLRLPGAQSGQRYELTIAGDCQDALGTRLKEATRRSVVITDMPPTLSMERGLVTLERPGKGEANVFPVSSVNMGALRVRMRRVDEQELPGLIRRLTQWNAAGTFDATFAPQVERTLPATKVRNKPVVQGVELAGALGASGVGLVYLEVGESGAPAAAKRGHDWSLVAVTDLAITSKAGAQSNELWVTRLSDGSPVSGATVRFWSEDGKEVASAQTDARGRAAGPAYIEERAQYRLVTAAQGGDLAYQDMQDWQTQIALYNYNLPFEWSPRGAQLMGQIFSERGVYRSGETVHLKGFVRMSQPEGLALPKAREVEVVVTDPRGKVVKTERVKRSGMGGFALDVALDERATLGEWSVVARVDDDAEAALYGAFRVEAYRTPRFEVKIKPSAKDVIVGEPGSAEVEGRYLFGAPMKGAALTYTVVRRRGSFAPAGLEEFHFGAQPYDWWSDETWTGGDEVLERGEAVLDAEGKGAVTFNVSASAMQRGPQEVMIEAEVQDVDRQSIGATRGIAVHPAALYAGIKRPGYMAEAGKPLEVGLIAVDTAGAPQGGHALSATLKLRTWTSALKRSVGDGATWVSEPQDAVVGTCSARSSTKEVPCRFEPKEPGYYVIEAQIKDAAGRVSVSETSIWLWGSGAGSYWRMSEDEQVQLVLDKATYKAGDKARVLIQSPYVPARALVTVERQGVLYEQQIEIKQSAQTVEIPVDEAFMPNAFVSVVLVRGRVAASKKSAGVDAGKPAYKVGYANLKLDTSPQRLVAEVKADRERYAPGDEVVATVEVRDAKGQPVAGEVTFMAVDEGVLSLTGYKTPDVVSSLYSERALAVMTREGRRRLVSRLELKQAAGDKGDEGGDGLAGMNYRAKFATTAVYMPLVPVDASGRAQVRFKLPENLTTFRLMAVAVGDGHRFGSAESRILVTKPLLVRPALPRFVSTGDTLDVRAVVQATDGYSGPVEVSATVSGAMTLTGGGSQTIELAAGEAREVAFPAVAGVPGEAKVRFAVRGRGEGAEDGVEVVVPVRYPAPEEQIVSSGALTFQDPGLWRKMVLPQGVSKQTGELEVELSSSAYGELLPGLSYLTGYPYGCVEQTTGRTLPLVLLEDTLKEWDTPGMSAGKTREYAQAGVDRLLSMQTPHDGGLGYWPGAEVSHPWGSVYGGLAVVRARQRGYKASDEQVKALTDYLRAVMRGQVQAERWWSPEAIAATSAFAAWVLAEANEGEPSYHEHLFNTRAQLPVWARGFLAMAIHKQRSGGALTDRGDQLVKTLVDELLASAQSDGRTATIAGELDADRYWMTMDSPVRANAVALMTLLRVRANDPLVPQLAQWLLEARTGGRWISTQDNAFAVMALAEYLQTVEREAPQYDVVVGLGSKVLATQSMRGRSLQIKRVRVPMAELAKAEGALLTVTRQGEGGPLYYTLRLRHAQEAGRAVESHEGFSVKREYLHAEGAEAGKPVERVKAGQLVVVRLTVVAPVARRYVVVEDPLPAGFEPISLSFETSAGAARRAMDGVSLRDDDGSYDAWWWRPSFDHSEQRDDRVLLFADNMEPAVYVHTYLVRATTPGTFMAAGTRAAEMYHPQVFGAAPDRVVEVR